MVVNGVVVVLFYEVVGDRHEICIACKREYCENRTEFFWSIVEL